MHTLLPTILFTLLTSTSYAQHFAIGLDKMNIFYVGIDNPLHIAVQGHAMKDIVIKTSSGKVAGQGGRYVYTADSAGAAEITLYARANGKLKKIGSNYFRVRNLPDPIFKIGSGKDKMTKSEITAQQFVRAGDESFTFDYNYHIVEFYVCIVAADTCTFTTKKNTGNKLSEEIRADFQKLRPNDMVIFKHIMIRKPGGVLAELLPRMITIIE